MAVKKFSSREISIQIERTMIDDFGATAFAMLANLLFASPVGDPTLWQQPSKPPGYVGGHFRRNWLVSIGGFNTTELEGTDAAGASTLARGRAEIRRLRKFGPNLVLQNNVPYANRLALGHSTQAEEGWVDRAIDAALDFPPGRRDLP